MTRVLLVDDDRDLVEIFAGQLTRAGYQVRYADCLAEVTEIAQSDPPFDVLITDLHLPDGDGMAVAAAVKARFTLALTGSSAPSDAAVLLKAGFVEVLVKPISGKQLAEAVARTLKEHT